MEIASVALATVEIRRRKAERCQAGISSIVYQWRRGDARFQQLSRIEAIATPIRTEDVSRERGQNGRSSSSLWRSHRRHFQATQYEEYRLLGSRGHAVFAEPLCLTYLEHPSSEEARKNWAAFQADPEWQKVKADSEINGALANHIDSYLMDPTSFSGLK